MATWQSDEQAAPDVEAIVRAVMARLAGGGAEPPPPDHAPAAAAAATRIPPAGDPPAPDGELALNQSVISAAELDGVLQGVRLLRVPGRAVITPAARDLLRQGNVSIEFAPDGAPRTAAALVVGAAETACQPAALVEAARRRGTPVEQLARAGLIQVAGEMCDLVARAGHWGLLLTSRPAVALCLCNRRPAVRAALAHDGRQVADALSQIGANLLIVDPAGKSQHELSRMVLTFLAPGPRHCPPALRAALQ